MKEMNPKIKAFLDDLKALQEKHGVGIEDCSCGCCGYTTVYVQGSNESIRVEDLEDMYDIFC